MANWPSLPSWLQHGLFLIGSNQSYQWCPITVLKFWYGPRSKGFSPGFVCRIAKVLIAPDACCSADMSGSGVGVAAEKQTVRYPGGVSGSLGMWMANVQTIVFLERFSMVVVLTRANWRELPVIPRVNRPKRAPLGSSVSIVHVTVQLDLQADNDQPVDIESVGLHRFWLA